jgi:nitrite reductase (cytochrome c-552)
VELIQDRTYALRNRAMDALVELIADIHAARGDSANAGAGGASASGAASGGGEAGVSGRRVSAERIAEAQAFQRQAQFRIDFVEAENSTGFHAPQEAARILGEAIDLARRGQLALRPPAAPLASR